MKDAATDDTKQTVQRLFGEIRLSHFHEDELTVQLCLAWLNGPQLTNPKEATTKYDTYKHT